jgi:acyl-CoA thioester hydrolase
MTTPSEPFWNDERICLHRSPELVSRGISKSAPHMPPLKVHSLRIQTGDNDLPEDRFSDHVNNARYFAFINSTFQSWYRAMGLRGAIPDASAMMAHLEYDYRGEVKPPSWIECRIDAVKKGRSSLEHAIEILDLGLNGRGSRLVGVGRSVHVFVDRSTRRPAPWPDELLRKCFSQNEPAS